MALRPPNPITRVGKAANAAWEAVLGIGLAMVLGYYRDRWLGTDPFLFFGFLLLGMAHALRRLLKLSAETGGPPGDASAPRAPDEKAPDGEDRTGRHP